MSKNWEEKQISEVCESIVDCVNKTAPTVEFVTPYKMIRTTNVKKGNIDLSSVKYVTEDVYTKWTRRSTPQIGDVILTREAPIGEVGIVKTGDKIFLGQRLMQYRANPKALNSKFLLYSMQSSYMQQQILSHEGTGSTVSHIRVPDCTKFKIRVPDLSIQERIADILGSLDDKIELNRRMNETLEQMAVALYKHWFVDFGPFQDGEFVESGEFGQIPACLNITSIGSAVKVLGGGTPSTKVNDYWDNGDINWFSPTDLTSSKSMFMTKSAKRITEKGLNESSAKLFPAYSVMMTSRATIGVIAINREPASTNQGFIVLIPNEKFPASYLLLWLKSNMEKIRSISNGSTFLEVNRSNFKALPIFESEKVIEFGARINPVLSQIESLTIETETLTETRDYLLPRLLSGEIEVRAAEEQAEEVLAGG